MTVLKWLVVLVSVGYLGGLVVLFFAQRAFIFRYRKRRGRRLPLPAFRKLKSIF